MALQKYGKVPVALDKKVIRLDDPWRDDLYKRGEYAEQLTGLLYNQEHSVVVALDGAWGCGKSFFLERWMLDLQRKNYVGVYLNAWKDDFLEDPLIALAIRINEAIKGFAERQEDAWDALKANGKMLLANIGVSVASKCLEHFTGLSLGDLKAETLRTASEKALDAYRQASEMRDSIIAGVASTAKAVHARTGANLVVVVDELDRCRPTYAIEMLERIKHIFSVPHVMFVLGVDKTQLMNSITAVYGNINASQYLYRFIDLEFHLPAPDRTAFLKALWDKYQIEKYIKDYDVSVKSALRNARKCMAYLSRMHSFTLREVEILFKTYTLVLRASLKSGEVYPMLVAALLVLRLLDAQLYEEWINGLCPVRDVVDVLIPIDRVSGFPLFEEFAAAVFATHYRASASIAAPTNRFLNFIREKPIKEYKGPVPKCFGKFTRKRTDSFFAKLDLAMQDGPKSKRYGIKALRSVASKIDFMVVELRENVGMHDGVSVVSRKEKCKG